ncbi:hypothetical protein TB1_035715 [Malus domestica]
MAREGDQINNMMSTDVNALQSFSDRPAASVFQFNSFILNSIPVVETPTSFTVLGCELTANAFIRPPLFLQRCGFL